MASAALTAKQDPPTAVLLDENAGRLQVLREVVAACGVPVETAGRQLPARGVALLGLEGVPASPQSLDLIRNLRGKGLRVIAFAEGFRQWPLGAVCQVLAAGASAALDSAGETFPDELRRNLAGALEEERAKAEEEGGLRATMSRFGMVGESRAMLDVFRWVFRVSALSDLPLLISGETGTGKELVARAVHQLDEKRRHGPFVALNCAAISAGLAESELFGHRRGAFTGADRDRKGLFRAAEGGTLFLDEISELGRELQGKLLRVLQDHRVLAVGDDEELPVNVRVIAATNRNLAAMVERGEYRADLFYRLNVVSLQIPPLRERLEDLAPLVRHILGKYAALRPGGGTRTAEGDFLQALAQLELRGNVRELENLLHNVVLNKKDNRALKITDLPPHVWQQVAASREASPSGPAPPRPEPAMDFASLLEQHGWSLSRALDYCERGLLEAALAREQGNQSRAARRLGITPRSVYNKLHKARAAAS